jgi:hypothetical protein
MTTPLADLAGAADAPSPTVSLGRVAPALILRIEGAALALVAVMLYGRAGTSWWLFASLLMLPDLGMIGFVRGPRVGAFTYNLTHTLAIPLALAITGLVADRAGLLNVALIWVAHIGADRAMGYGLKYSTHFRDTHLQRLT